MKGELIKENPRLHSGLYKVLSKENAILKVMFPFTSIHTLFLCNATASLTPLLILSPKPGFVWISHASDLSLDIIPLLICPYCLDTFSMFP